MARIIDISLPIGPNLPVWPGDPPVEVNWIARISAGDPFSLSELRTSTHAGTHVDAPAHFVGDGATIDELALDTLIGPASVVELIEGRLGIPEGCERLLVRTGGAGLPEEAARAFIDRGVRLVGVDAPSVDPRDSIEFTVHRALLEAGVVIVERLDLSEAAPGDYTLVCLPLRIEGGDGSPARVVLLED